jgi:DNA-binding PadR family transcriptional regulator
MTDQPRRPTGRGAASGVLDLALLGLLADAPMHGYQLRVRLGEILGPLRSYSYGSLYPALRRLEGAGLLVVQQPLSDPDEVPLAPRRSRVTYRITAAGKERLADLLADAGPQSWSDEGFGVHLALFPRTAVQTRLRILEGRRQRLEQRREGLRAALSRTARRVDDYTVQLHRLAIQAHDREVLWLRELIAQEGQKGRVPEPHPGPDANSAPGATAASPSGAAPRPGADAPADGPSHPAPEPRSDAGGQPRPAQH